MAARERKVVYLVATSVDGFIAAEDGSIDAFPFDPEFMSAFFARYPETCPGHLRESLGVEGDNQRFDTVLMGRATYTPALALGVTDPYPTLDQYVVSTTLAPPPSGSAVTLVRDDLAGLVARLKSAGGRKDIWLAGGSVLAGSMLDAGLIDELILKVNPFVLGRGLALFGHGTARLDLAPVAAETLGGVSVLHFRRRD